MYHPAKHFGWPSTHASTVITPPNGSGLPEHDNDVRHTAETAKEPLEEHDKEAEGLPVL